ncbi:2-hydroxyacid dehydrogenase [Pseudomonas sp. JDS28PS106]|uniref:2-hydroxyacid dehydrogenase n=1 Tax=Pseudomonas sp. JDS28PS106 TaxID=2497235 RepID=UPI002FD15EBE
MSIDILLTQPVPAPIDQRLQALYIVHRLYEMPDQDAFLSRHGASIRAVVTGGAKGLSNSIMDRLPALQVIAISGIGTDAVDLKHAARRGVQVTTTPGVLTDDVADMGMGLLIMTLRDLATGERIVRSGQWGAVAQPLARKVTGIKLGIVGLGRVGHAIARRAQAFNMSILYTDLHEQPASGYTFFADLIDLARECDVLMLAASADHGQTIITAPVLQALGPQGYLINVARGKLVDEPALISALSSRTIAGAGLDVFVDEPNVPLALRALNNVVLQPHRASATEQTRLEMGEIVLANLEACFAGAPLPTAVAC